MINAIEKFNKGNKTVWNYLLFNLENTNNTQ